MTGDRCAADALGLSVGVIRWCRLRGVDPAVVALDRRRRILAPLNPNEGADMDGERIDGAALVEARETLARAEAAEFGLTPDELAIARRTGMDPRRYAAIKGAPTTTGNGRSVHSVQAAVAAANNPTDQEAA